jgi:hypothetical protein
VAKIWKAGPLFLAWVFRGVPVEGRWRVGETAESCLLGGLGFPEPLRLESAAIFLRGNDPTHSPHAFSGWRLPEGAGVENGCRGVSARARDPGEPGRFRMWQWEGWGGGWGGHPVHDAPPPVGAGRNLSRVNSRRRTGRGRAEHELFGSNQAKRWHGGNAGFRDPHRERFSRKAQEPFCWAPVTSCARRHLGS